MKTIVGIFRSGKETDRAAERLRAAGIAGDHLNIFYGGEGIEDLQALPQTAGEQPGMGKALGAVVGGATGAAAGVSLPALMTLIVPGIGPVIAIGTAAGAILGLIGAVGGAAVGASLEGSLTEGLPADEVYLYADALRKGRSVVVAHVEDDAHAKTAEETMAGAGAETIDAAREAWWVGLRDAEKEHYSALGKNFDTDESLYRRGFEAAMSLRWKGHSYEESKTQLRDRFGESASEESFLRGFERGRQYSMNWLRTSESETQTKAL